MLTYWEMGDIIIGVDSKGVAELTSAAPFFIIRAGGIIVLKIIAEFFVKPESTDAAMKLAKELVTKTQKEQGCIAYNLFADNENDSHIVIIEEWHSQEVLDMHSASDHFLQLVPAIAALCEKDPSVRTFTKIV